MLRFTYFGSHDGDYMLIRGLVAEQMLKEGQIPLRWSGSLQHGCGAPIFTFFYPLFGYIVGGLALYTDLSIPMLMKWFYWSFFILAASGFFLWMYKETKDEMASFLGGILYLFAPYRFVLVFVRGSIEGLGLALLPWVLLSMKYVFDKPSSPWRWLIAVLIGAAFFVSHNLVVLVSLPILAIYFLTLVRRGGKLRWAITLFAFWVGLSLFFWGPAILEQRFTQLPVQAPHILENLPSLTQLVYSPWGFGPIVAAQNGGTPTGISFSVGIAQWLMLLLSAVVGLWLALKQRRISPLLMLVVATLFVIFLNSNISAFIWKMFPAMGIIQFPWRLLGISAVLISVTASVTLSLIKNKQIRYFLVIGISILAFVSVRNYMGANPTLNPKVYEGNMSAHGNRYGTATVSDEIIPASQQLACSAGTPVVKGEGIVPVRREVAETYGHASFKAPRGRQNLTVFLSYFPGLYELKLNGNDISYEEDQGFVVLKGAELEEGSNEVSWKIKETPIEIFFSRASLFWLVFVFIFLAGMQIYSSKEKSQD